MARSKRGPLNLGEGNTAAFGNEKKGGADAEAIQKREQPVQGW